MQTILGVTLSFCMHCIPWKWSDAWHADAEAIMPDCSCCSRTKIILAQQLIPEHKLKTIVMHSIEAKFW